MRKIIFNLLIRIRSLKHTIPFRSSNKCEKCTEMVAEKLLKMHKNKMNIDAR